MTSIKCAKCVQIGTRADRDFDNPDDFRLERDASRDADNLVGFWLVCTGCGSKFELTLEKPNTDKEN
jgi:hypothetical protein